MEKINEVMLTVWYTLKNGRGEVLVDFNSRGFEDEVIALAVAIRKDERLRSVVLQALDFLITPEFQEFFATQGI